MGTNLYSISSITYQHKSSSGPFWSHKSLENRQKWSVTKEFNPRREFAALHTLIPSMSRPGMLPMYVRRCPRMSASSFTPPKEIRMKRRFRAPAMDDAREVLPTPGGPTKHKTGPRASGFSCKNQQHSQNLMTNGRFKQFEGVWDETVQPAYHDHNHPWWCYWFKEWLCKEVISVINVCLPL